MFICGLQEQADRLSGVEGSARYMNRSLTELRWVSEKRGSRGYRWLYQDAGTLFLSRKRFQIEKALGI